MNREEGNGISNTLSEGMKQLDVGYRSVFGCGLIQSAINMLEDPRNYSTHLIGVNLKGKNRTFKKKTSRKRVLYKDYKFDEFKAILTSYGRWNR